MATGTTTTDPVPQPPRPPVVNRAAEREQFIEDQLRRTRTHVKVVDIVTGLMILAAGSLAFFLAAAVIDGWVIPGGLGFWSRLGLLVLYVAGATYFFVHQILPLFIRRINPVYAAQAIEHAQPTLKNSLINFLLFRSHRPGNEVVYRALEARAASDLKHAPVDSAVDRSKLITIGYVLAGVLAASCLYKVLSPKDPLQTVGRVILPWSDIRPSSRVTITDVQPGHKTVYRGERLAVSAEVQGLSGGDHVTLYYTTADGRSVNQAVQMFVPNGGYRHECLVPDAQGAIHETFDYRIEAGDASTATYHVEVVTAPTVVIDHVDYDPPAYTGRPKRTADRQGDIKDLEGTQVTVHAVTNQPIKQAWIEFGGEGQQRDRVKLRTDDQRAWGSFALSTKDGDRMTSQYPDYRVYFTNQDGNKNPEPVRYRIEVIPDLPPEIAMLAPEQEETAVPLDGETPIEVRALDPDFGLGAVILMATRKGEPLLETVLVDGPWQGQFVRTFPFVPRKLNLKEGDAVQVWAVAKDVKTPVPNVAETPKRVIKVVSAQQPPQGDQQGKPGDKGGKGDQKQPNQGGPNQNNPDPQGQQNGKDGKNDQPKDQVNQGPANQQNQDQKNQKDQQGQKGKGDGQGKDQKQGGGDKNNNKNDQGQQDGQGEKGEGKNDAQQGENKDGKDQNQSGNGQQGKQQDKSPTGQQGNGQKQQGDQQQNEGDPNKDAQDQKDQNQGSEGKGKPDKNQQGKGSKSGGAGGQQGEAGDKGDSSSNQPVASDGRDDGRAIDEILKDQQNEGQSGQGSDGKSGKDSQPKDGPSKGAQGKGDPSQGQTSKGDPKQSGADQKGQSQTGPSKDGQPKDGQSSGAQPQGGQPKPGDKKDGQSQGAGKDPQGNKDAQGGADPRGAKSGQDKTGLQPQADAPNKLPNGKTGDGQEQGEKKPDQGSLPFQKRDDAQQQDGGAQNREPNAANAKPGQPKDGQEKPGGQRADPSGAGQQQSDQQKDGQAGGQQKKDQQGSGQKDGDQSAQQQGGGQQSGDKSGGQSKSGDQGNTAPTQQPQGSGDSKKPDDKGSDPGDAPNQDSKRSSSTKGKTDGDRSGEGAKGGGQSSNQEGTGGQGQKSPSDQGQGQSQDQGQGNKSNEAGQDQKSDQPTGQSGDKQGQGSASRPKQDGGNDKSGGSKPGNPKDDQGQSPAGQDGAGTKDGGSQSGNQVSMPRGGGEAGGTEPGGQQGEAPPDDQANLEYARKATDLAIEHLKDQAGKDNSTLLEKLGWTPDEARSFIERYEKLKQEAGQSGSTGDAAGQKRDDLLRSLGLRPGRTEVKAKTADDEIRGNRQGPRTKPPADYAEQFEAFTKGRALAEPPKKP